MVRHTRPRGLFVHGVKHVPPTVLVLSIQIPPRISRNLLKATKN